MLPRLSLRPSVIGINAYHQPGVEAGKEAAASTLALQGKVLAALSEVPRTAQQIALRQVFPTQSRQSACFWSTSRRTAEPSPTELILLVR